jgi:predicted lipoprotein
VPAMGDTPAAARPALLPLYRSELTSRYLAAGMTALADFYATSQLGATLPPGEAWIDAAVRDELRRVLDDLAALQMPASRAVADPTQRDLLVHIALLLDNARAIVDEYLAPALGVNPGFNALDGD